jgi:hypothetical protein
MSIASLFAAYGSSVQAQGARGSAPPGAAARPQSGSRPPSRAVEDIESTIKRFYVAMRFVNVDSTMAMVAPDFRVVARRDSLTRLQFRRMMERMTRGAPQDITDFVTTVRDTIATTTYKRTAINIRGTRFTVIESATLRLVKGRWLIVRMEASE